MQVHGMVLPSEQVGPLEHHLHARIVLQHLNLGPGLGENQALRQVVPGEIEVERGPVRQIRIEHPGDLLVVSPEHIDGRGNKGYVVEAGR